MILSQYLLNYLERHRVATIIIILKSKVIPQQAEVAQGVSGRLRPRIISTFGTAKVLGRQPYAPAAFTPGEIPGTHFQRRSRPQGTWFCRKEPRKKIPSDTTVNRSQDHYYYYYYYYYYYSRLSQVLSGDVKLPEWGFEPSIFRGFASGLMK